MFRTFWLLGALLALVGVGLGAFGAHGLRARVEPDLLAVWETAVRYQMYHALALLVVAGFADRLAAPWVGWAGWLFVAGVLVFSGSLYVLVLSGTRWLGAITPLGGLAMLAGWTLLLVAALRAS